MTMTIQEISDRILDLSNEMHALAKKAQYELNNNRLVVLIADSLNNYSYTLDTFSEALADEAHREEA